MNELYAQIMLHTHTEDMIVNDYYTYSYYETIINARTVTDKESLSHVVDVYFAVREWREYDNPNYPVDIDIYR